MTTVSQYGKDPWYELRDLQRHMDRIFENLMSERGGGSEFTDWRGGQRYKGGKGREMGGEEYEFQPELDVYEDDDFYHVLFDLPGVTKDHINLEVKDDVLCVCGDKCEKWQKQENVHLHRNERNCGKFCRKLTLPEGVDLNKIDANLHDGLLEVKICKPKREETRGEKGRHIEVREEQWAQSPRKEEHRRESLGKEKKRDEYEKEPKREEYRKESLGKEKKRDEYEKEPKREEYGKSPKKEKEYKKEGKRDKEIPVEGREPTFLRAGEHYEK